MSANYIGAKPVWSVTNISGFWTLTKAKEMKDENKWPRGPDAPTNLAATGSDAEIALTWTAPVNTYGSITNYAVEYTPAGGSPTVVLTNSATESYTVTGLTNDTEYTFRVVAINHTQGDYSAAVTGTPGTAIGGGVSGYLYSWGYNSDGRLGTGDSTIRTSPVKIGSASYKAISAGLRNSYAIDVDGARWAWGSTSRGAIGDGSSSGTRYTPVQIGTDLWTSIDGGWFYSIAIREDGTLWGNGMNSFLAPGALGVGNETTDYYTPVQIGSDTWLFINVGYATSFGIKSNGTLWGWGSNAYGCLGVGTNISTYDSPVQIDSDSWLMVSKAQDSGYTSNQHAAGIKSDGTLWAWGSNTNGAVGDGTTTQRNTPVQIGSAADWSYVSAGADYTLAIKTDGSLWGWGHNNTGKVGNGSTSNQLSPVRIGTDSWSVVAAGSDTSHGIKPDGTLWSWGRNGGNYGLLGIGSTTSANYTSPVQVGSDADWVAVSAGKEFALALKQS
jgi:alpha-tubulin suppressor-like RCC1 family protein